MEVVWPSVFVVVAAVERTSRYRVCRFESIMVRRVIFSIFSLMVVDSASSSSYNKKI